VGVNVLHLLPGEDAVFDWVSGTALRLIFAALDEVGRAQSCVEYGASLREAYPRRGYGTVMRYWRIFGVACRA